MVTHCSLGRWCPVLTFAPLFSPVLVHGDHQPHPLLLPELLPALQQPRPQPRRGDGQQQRAGAAALLGALTAAQDVWGPSAVPCSLGHHGAAVPSCTPAGSAVLSILWNVGFSRRAPCRLKVAPPPHAWCCSSLCPCPGKTRKRSMDIFGGMCSQSHSGLFLGLWCCSVMSGHGLHLQGEEPFCAYTKADLRFLPLHLCAANKHLGSPQ